MGFNLGLHSSGEKAKVYYKYTASWRVLQHIFVSKITRCIYAIGVVGVDDVARLPLLAS